MTPALEVSDLTVRLGGAEVLQAVSVTAVSGAMTAIVGPNGAGKSTLLRAALGLVPAVSGTVRVLGQPFAQVRTRVAFVPQRTAVDWDFPVRAVDVVQMGLYARLGPWRWSAWTGWAWRTWPPARSAPSRAASASA